MRRFNSITAKPQVNFLLVTLCTIQLIALWNYSNNCQKIITVTAIVLNLTIGIMALHTEHCRYVWDDGHSPEMNERSHHFDTHILLDKFYDSDIKLAQMWCDAHGYTELEIRQDTPEKFWAFPPLAVMPVNLDWVEVKRWCSEGNDARNK